MFTGIVEELGTVEAVEHQGDALRLTIRAATVLSDAGLGDSISVNGCCLTVAERSDGTSEAVGTAAHRYSFANDHIPKSRLFGDRRRRRA